MGGTSSVLGWVSAPLRWGPVSISDLNRIRQVQRQPALLRPGSSTESDEVLLKRVEKLVLALFHKDCNKKLSRPVSGGYSEELRDLLRSSGTALETKIDALPKYVAEDSSSDGGSSTTGPSSSDEIAGVDHTEAPTANFRSVALHVLRIVEQFCFIDKKPDGTPLADPVDQAAIENRLILPPQERLELLTGVLLLRRGLEHFLLRGVTARELFDFPSLAPKEEQRISMQIRFPASMSIFMMRRASLVGSLDSKLPERAVHPIFKVLAEMSRLLLCLFSSQLTSPATEPADLLFYDALGSQNGAMIQPFIHFLLNGFMSFSALRLDTDKSSQPTTTALLPVLSPEQQKQLISLKGREGRQELSLIPTISIRPLTFSEAAKDVGKSFLYMLSFPFRFIYQGIRVATGTVPLTSVNIPFPLAMSEAARRNAHAGTVLVSSYGEAFLALLLVLIQPSCPKDGSETSSAIQMREALNSIVDSHYPLGSGVSPYVQVDFTALFEGILSGGVINSSRMLLLYFLLQGCKDFREYVLARSDCDTLFLPILRQLHSAVRRPDEWGQHEFITLMLIVLHMLTQDASFNKVLHTIQINDVAWLGESGYASPISLANLTVIVLIHVLTSNIHTLMDPSIHSSCSAILTNMIASFTDLSPAVGQKLVSFTGILYTLFKELSEEHKGDGEEDEEVKTFREFLHQHLELILEIIKVGLEKNPGIIHGLISEKELIVSLSQEPGFKEITGYLMHVIEFFENVILVLPAAERSMGNLMKYFAMKAPECLEGAGLPPPDNRTFSYNENTENAISFFRPLIWMSIFANNLCPAAEEQISLFVTPSVFERELEENSTGSSSSGSGSDSEAVDESLPEVSKDMATKTIEEEKKEEEAKTASDEIV